MASVRKAAAAVFAALALLAGAQAAAQVPVPDPYAGQLASGLAHAQTTVTDDGFMLAAGPFAGGLPNRIARRIIINLRAGHEYRFVGVCDTRCSDMDLRLYDPSSQMVAEDTLDNDHPILRVRANVTGPHQVEVSMYRCGADRCWYAFNVYSR